MNPLKYIAHQISSFNENYEITKDVVRINRIGTFIDYLFCSVKYGSSASDYFELEFYDKSNVARSRFLTYKPKMELFHKINDYSKKELFDNKIQFFKTFPEYIKRDWLDIGEASFNEFCTFVEKHNSFMAKPIASSGGRGVRKLTISGGVLKKYLIYMRS